MTSVEDAVSGRWTGSGRMSARRHRSASAQTKAGDPDGIARRFFIYREVYSIAA
jgi:hypothetical protein